MSYGHLIRRPFDIVARRPYLWLLGFLAGGATGFNLPSSGTNYGHPTTSGSYKGPSWTVLQNVWNANWEWVVGILACVVVLGFVLFVLSCIATGGIIRPPVGHDMDREYKLGTPWRAGYLTGWGIAGLQLPTLLLRIVPGLLIGAPVLGAGGGALG